MDVLAEGENSFFLGCAAHILDDLHELAWAEEYANNNANYKWILGKYAEADQPNRNRQFMDSANLAFGQPSLQHGPLNINHTPLIVGNFVQSRLLKPGENSAKDYSIKTHLEALSVMWAARYPDEYIEVEKAHRLNQLYYSMEARPETVVCAGQHGCGREFAYIQRFDPSYCAHLNNPESGAIKDMRNPQFMGGALIVPPTKPGWGNATIDQISAAVVRHGDVAERAYDTVARQLPDASTATWETIAMQIALHVDGESAKDFSKKLRKSLASSGMAMKDGSFPIVTTQDLTNAIQAIGRAKDPAAAKKHIKKRAKALGKSDVLPNDWGTPANVSGM